MSNRLTIKVHPDIQVDNNVPDVLTGSTFISSYKTYLFIDGKFVLKFKVSLLIRKDAETDPTYTYTRYMRFGFLPPKSQDEFYQACNYCYQTSIIEFNKSLDVVFGRDRFPDEQFISFEELKKMVDTALNPQVN